MKRLLFVLMLIAVVAFSGCTEKSPGGNEKSLNATEIKMQVIKSAENLSTYNLTSSMRQTLKLNAPAGNKTAHDNVTVITESATTAASVDLIGFKAKAVGSTNNTLEMPGQAANTSSSEAMVYQIGNSTYVRDGSGKWTRLVDPRAAQEIWGEGNNNQVKALAEKINQSQVEVIGSEKIEGVDSYKLKITPGSGEFYNLYNTAFGVAAKLTQYPMFVPSINSTELNESSKMEKLIWISKETYLPTKYQSSLSFDMTPIIIGGMDPNTGNMIRFNQSMRLGEISVNIETTDVYTGFDTPLQIAPPEEALKAESISPSQIQLASTA
jgi:hypothetical protein